MAILTTLPGLPGPLQSEISLLRDIVNQTLSGYSAETPLSDKLAVANIIHFSVAAYNRLVSALYYPASPPISHLYDWASISEKLDGTGSAADALPVNAAELIFPHESVTGLTDSEYADRYEVIF